MTLEKAIKTCETCHNRYTGGDKKCLQMVMDVSNTIMRARQLLDAQLLEGFDLPVEYARKACSACDLKEPRIKRVIVDKQSYGNFESY